MGLDRTDGLALVALLFFGAGVGCGDDDGGRGDAAIARDAGTRDSGARDGGVPDSGPRDAGGAPDRGGDPCAPPPAPPTAPLRPTAGELFYVQLGLGGLSTGEAALIVGPDGTRVLVDVGNDS